MSRAFSAILAITVAVTLLLGAGPSSAGKKEAASPASSTAGGKAAAPVIRRLATIQDERGEKLLRSPLALVRDRANGDLLVTSFESGEVVILDRNGALLKRMGKTAGLATPYGLAVDRQGRIFVSEVQTGQLKILSPAGSLLDQLDLGKIRGRRVSPGRIALDSDGRICVADLASGEILILGEKGDLLRALGPVAYLQKAEFLAGDRIIGVGGQGTAVRIYARDGNVLHSFGEHGDESERNVSFPAGFAIDAKERLWIADAFQHRLKVFTLEGKFLFNFGWLEDERGGFLFPVDLCFAEDGRLFVLEKGANRIQIFQVDDLKGMAR